MVSMGGACLILSLHGVAASWYGARSRPRHWLDSGRRAMHAVAALATVAVAISETAGLTSDLSRAVVYAHSSTTATAANPRAPTVPHANRRVAQPARGPRTPSALSLLITVTAGVLAVVALVAVIPSVGALALVAALVVLILASAALLAVTGRLLDETGDEQ